MSRVTRDERMLGENVLLSWSLVVQCADTADPISGGPVLVRAHGATPAGAISDAIETVDGLLAHYHRIRERLGQESTT